MTNGKRGLAEDESGEFGRYRVYTLRQIQSLKVLSNVAGRWCLVYLACGLVTADFACWRRQWRGAPALCVRCEEDVQARNLAFEPNLSPSGALPYPEGATRSCVPGAGRRCHSPGLASTASRGCLAIRETNWSAEQGPQQAVAPPERTESLLNSRSLPSTKRAFSRSVTVRRARQS